MINLEQLEHLAYTRQRAPAIRQLLQLLEGIDACSGELERALETSQPSGSLTPPGELVARVTAAISALASAPDFVLSLDEYRALMVHHGWLGALFAASAFGHADHVLRALSIDGGSSGELRIAAKNLPAFCLFYCAESEVPLNIEGLWAIGPPLAAGLFVSLLAAPFLATPAAHEKQQRLLSWLAAHLAEIEDLDYLPAAVLYRVYMRCSYADRPEKHAIKRPINQLIRAKLRQRGLADRPDGADGAAPAAAGGKPAVLVVVDWFQHGHSIYRTHSRAIDGLRSRFRVVGAGYPESVDDAGRAVFDEFHALSPGAGIWKNLEELRDLAAARGARILYMPSVGMSTLSVFAANLRVAPVTVIGLGHPATTLSPTVDFVAVEEDFVGDPGCFSERLLLLPKDGQPYRPGQPFDPVPRRARLPGQAVQIAVVATSFKLNPRFLSACAQIAAQARTRVHLHFFVGNASGLVAVAVRRLLEGRFGERASFHPRQPYAEYMRAVGRCEMFINAFPFGNTNGIVDTVAAGLVGVCRTGPEVHEHIDEGLFRRLGLPDWLVTRSDSEYVAAACRLVDDESERQRLSQQLAGPAAVQTLFRGRPEALAERLCDLGRSGGRAGSGARAPSAVGLS